MFTVWRIPGAIIRASEGFQKSQMGGQALCLLLKDYFREDADKVERIEERWAPLREQPKDYILITKSGVWPCVLARHVKGDHVAGKRLSIECRVQQMDTYEKACSVAIKEASKVGRDCFTFQEGDEHNWSSVVTYSDGRVEKLKNGVKLSAA